jgi:autotransporter adhesin
MGSGTATAGQVGAAASASDAIALGRGAVASASKGIAVGQGATADQANSVALGDGVDTTAASQVNIGTKRLMVGCPTTNAPDADFINGQMSWAVDEGTNTLIFKVKYSGGTFKSGTVPLV